MGNDGMSGAMDSFKKLEQAENSRLRARVAELDAELARLREAMLEACEHIEQHRYGIGMLALNEALAQEVEKP